MTRGATKCDNCPNTDICDTAKQVEAYRKANGVLKAELKRLIEDNEKLVRQAIGARAQNALLQSALPQA